MAKASQALEKYCPIADPAEQGLKCANPGAHIISGMVIKKLQDWIASPRSDLLWVIGLPFPQDSEATLPAAHIENMATAARLPYVSFFCTPDAEFPERVDDDRPGGLDRYPL